MGEAAAVSYGWQGLGEAERAELAERARRLGRLSAGEGVFARRTGAAEAELCRKMLFALATDIREIFLVLADKLSLLRAAGPEGDARLAEECLAVYAPLAERLGMSQVKAEIEDRALAALNPQVYAQIARLLSLTQAEREAFLAEVRTALEREAAKAGIAVEVKSRVKHAYSIYQKMRKRNKAAGEVLDILAARLVCGSTEDCYTLLGIVHRLWKPLDGRFKDYIARPKANGYQSLHTTVRASGGGMEETPLEIQIRTREMHTTAEFGPASHWLYKRAAGGEVVREADLGAVNALKSAASRGAGARGGLEPGDYFAALKKQILSGAVYVFTPQGKIIALPEGATPIDFAYAIHSTIGEHCSLAKADGEVVPLSAPLRHGQVVDILTSQAARPHENWLQVVKSARARNRIRQWLAAHGEGAASGEAGEAKAAAASAFRAKAAEAAPEAAPERGEPDSALDEVFRNEAPGGAEMRVRVGDERNMLVRFARCCNPVLGDPITGYVSRGRGIIIHRQNCRSLRHIPDFEERRIDTVWEAGGKRRFRVEARRRVGLFSEIEGAVRKCQGRLVEGRLEERPGQKLVGTFTMSLEESGADGQGASGGQALKKALKNIRAIPSVLSVTAE